MGRIQKAYETRFRWLLRLVNARRIDHGVRWLMQKAGRVSSDRRISAADALTQVAEELAARPAFQKKPSPAPELFMCDAGLGGLARWLRAAGYNARWEAGIEDTVLLKQAQALEAVILTTDSMLMERRLIRDRIVPAFWLPPTLSIPEQLESVFREFNLRLRERRCMSCGGRLAEANKEELRERIPPRTYLWKDQFFLCGSCGKLFWHGTHWERIQRQLEQLASKIGGTEF